MFVCSIPQPATSRMLRVADGGGVLERLLVFFLVLGGQFTALGFVIAAKGIARFRELEQREFAEYFLIGTMLSLIIAGGIALLTKALLV